MAGVFNENARAIRRGARKKAERGGKYEKMRRNCGIRDENDSGGAVDDSADEPSRRKRNPSSTVRDLISQ